MIMKNSQHLLSKINLIIKSEKESKKIKGENFNIFEILNVESKENNTHSNFIGELLNPHGRHLKGSLFLELFLQEIKDNRLDIASTNVYLEKNIGRTEINNNIKEESTGGRIDIYLEDKNGQSISIENKIYARDQPAQIIRYHNHNKTKNKVYYLTLAGSHPTEISSGKLVQDADFFTLSYSNHIINWLEKAQQIATNEPILRETIKQYNLLIQKLTNTMSNEHNQQLLHSILADFEAAKAVEANITAARKIICGEIYDAVFNELNKALENHPDFIVERLGQVHDKFACIDISFKNFKTKDRNLHFDLESFSGDAHYNGQLFIGILNPPPHNSEFALSKDNKLSVWRWIINEKQLPSLDGTAINLSNPATIQRLHNEVGFKALFVAHIVKETLSYIESEYPNLKKYLISLNTPS
jgi:hypothetical protein